MTFELINLMEFFHHMYFKLTHYISGTGLALLSSLSFPSQTLLRNYLHPD